MPLHYICILKSGRALSWWRISRRSRIISMCSLAIHFLYHEWSSYLSCYISHVSEHWKLLPFFYPLLLALLILRRICATVFTKPAVKIYLMYRHPQVVLEKITNYRIRAVRWISNRWRYKSVQREWAPVLRQPLSLLYEKYIHNILQIFQIYQSFKIFLNFYNDIMVYTRSK